MSRRLQQRRANSRLRGCGSIGHDVNRFPSGWEASRCFISESKLGKPHVHALMNMHVSLGGYMRRGNQTGHVITRNLTSPPRVFSRRHRNYLRMTRQPLVNRSDFETYQCPVAAANVDPTSEASSAERSCENSQQAIQVAVPHTLEARLWLRPALLRPSRCPSTSRHAKSSDSNTLARHEQARGCLSRPTSRDISSNATSHLEPTPYTSQLLNAFKNTVEKGTHETCPHTRDHAAQE